MKIKTMYQRIVELDDSEQFYDDARNHYAYLLTTDDDDLKQRCVQHIKNIYKALVAIQKVKQSHTIA
jgi:hypothetical protein